MISQHPALTWTIAAEIYFTHAHSNTFWSAKCSCKSKHEGRSVYVLTQLLVWTCSHKMHVSNTEGAFGSEHRVSFQLKKKKVWLRRGGNAQEKVVCAFPWWEAVDGLLGVFCQDLSPWQPALYFTHPWKRDPRHSFYVPVRAVYGPAQRHSLSSAYPHKPSLIHSKSALLHSAQPAKNYIDDMHATLHHLCAKQWYVVDVGLCELSDRGSILSCRSVATFQQQEVPFAATTKFH